MWLREGNQAEPKVFPKFRDRAGNPGAWGTGIHRVKIQRGKIYMDGNPEICIAVSWIFQLRTDEYMGVKPQYGEM